MSAGLPKYITVNLSTLSKKFTDGEEVSLESLTQKRMLNLSGREAKLPLKVLLKLFRLLQSKPDLIVAVPGVFVPSSNPVCLCIPFYLVFITFSLQLNLYCHAFRAASCQEHLHKHSFCTQYLHVHLLVLRP